jgi:hypothetical protein
MTCTLQSCADAAIVAAALTLLNTQTLPQTLCWPGAVAHCSHLFVDGSSLAALDIFKEEEQHVFELTPCCAPECLTTVLQPAGLPPTMVCPLMLGAAASVHNS